MSERLRLPRTVPKDGQVQILMRLKTSRGNTLELVGTFNEAKVLKIWTAIQKAEEKAL